MKKILYLTFLLLLLPHLYGQMPVGSWSAHLRFNTSKNIAAGSNEIYSSTGSAILVYNKEFSELKKLSTVNGLSATGISTIAWSEENETLIIGYNSSNIDLVRNNTIFNIPDILNTYIAGEKRINTIVPSGRYAYLATGFGIVVVDLIKREIRDTWRPGPGPDPVIVYDVAFGNNKVYAATDMGVWYGDLSNQGLAYFGNWEQVTELPDPDSKCTLVLFTGNVLYVNISQTPSEGDSIFKIDGEASLFSFTPGVFNRSFDNSPDGFTVSSSGFSRFYSSDGSLKYSIASYGWGTPDISQTIAEAGVTWLADLEHGLIRSPGNTDFEILSLPGPASDFAANITSAGGRTIICAGGTDYTHTKPGRPFQVSVHEAGEFLSIAPAGLSDAVKSFIDPDNSNHFFVASYGDGLLEFNNNTITGQFNAGNTPQLAINSGNSGTMIRGLAMDREKNLWITQTGTTGSIKILKADGSWIVNPLTTGSPAAGDIISTSGGQKWIVLPGGYGLFVIDDNDTPLVFSDDRSIRLTVTDADGKTIPNVFSVAEDLDGNIWAGTDQGPVIYYNAGRVFEPDFRAGRIKVQRNDGSGLADYMLGTETITSIAVDGANRKWVGTKSSGAYLLSADGTAMVKNFNTGNSPLFSDSIASVAVDNKTGEVWFGTSRGAISVREVATLGSGDFNNVYAFPNPVREDYNGNVTITGLLRDTEVKITDISGNLVFETMSEGGQAEWDLSTFTGKRVKTGVYVVFCSGAEGSRSSVTKILVVGN